jgi:hypothetical protein
MSARLTHERLVAQADLMMRKKTRRWVGLLCAIVLVSSQQAVAAHDCPLAARAPVAMEMPADCTGEMDDARSPLCQAHCAQPAQSNQASSLDLPPLVLTGLWVLPTETGIEPALPARARGPAVEQSGAPPPLYLRLQVFRN